MVKDSGYPGMKILQYAFDPNDPGSCYMPFQYEHNTVVYTGTHDNETMRGWYDSVNRKDRAFAKAYCGIRSEKTAAWEFIRTAFMSVGNTCIIPMQDYLNLGDEARINTPSTLGGNWMWRMQKGAASDELAQKMASLAELYGRADKKS